MTPVRNEAWVLHAFLKATSLWADYIIIADQGSTDGSREIALLYPKVILIENKDPNFNEAERQQLLISRAREIEGDKILFGLDADEIFSANFKETNDWQKILNSKPGDVFWFKWAEICPDLETYWESDKTYFPWMFHDDGIEPHGNYTRNMHSMRIPYPIEEKQMYYVKDFRVLHLAYINQSRVAAKLRFYKFVDLTLNGRNIVTLSRSYNKIKKEKIYHLDTKYVYSLDENGFTLFDQVNMTSNRFWFDDYVYERIKNENDKRIHKLDIWEKEFVDTFELIDQRSFLIKLLHTYLRATNKYQDHILIRIIDKILKRLV